MTCNFKNSAGTDLDDLFYTDNSNAGALGFKNSSGTDLGNKYSDTSTLGYAVGYKNSAGTDMGYLRGDKSAPEVSSESTNYNGCYNDYTTDGEADVYQTEYRFCKTFYFNSTILSATLTATYTADEENASGQNWFAISVHSNARTSCYSSSGKYAASSVSNAGSKTLTATKSDIDNSAVTIGLSVYPADTHAGNDAQACGTISYTLVVQSAGGEKEITGEETFTCLLYQGNTE